MIKIIFLGFPLHGHTCPTIGLVKELVGSGHEVIYYSVPDYQDMILHAGAEFRDYDVGLNSALISLARNPFPNLNLIQNKSIEIFAKLVDDIGMMKPDLIIHDGLSSWGKCLAAYLKIPAVSSIVTFALNLELLKVGVTKSGMIGLLCRRFFTKEGRMFPQVTANFSSLLRTCGLPACRSFDPVEFATNPEGLNIVYTTERWQPQREAFDETYCFIGPSITSRDDGNKLDLAIPADLPLIFISMGTMVNDNLAFFNMCFEAFGDMHAKIILSLGSAVDTHQLEHIPDNFSLYRYPHVPHFEVLRRANLFISHGGLNSTCESLYFLVPVIIYPITAEQTLNGSRVVEAGAGIMPKKRSASALRRAAETILSDHDYKRNCERISKDFDDTTGFKHGVDRILTYLRKANIR